LLFWLSLRPFYGTSGRETMEEALFVSTAIDGAVEFGSRQGVRDSWLARTKVCRFALIVFVMLTIVLGVTTYLFYRNWEDANNRTTAAVAETDRATKLAAANDKDANELKKLLASPRLKSSIPLPQRSTTT